MAITLSRLFAESETNYNIRLIAGQKGMKSLVRWVHMVEDSEVPGFLHGNELIFTTGIAHRGSGWIISFVKSLQSHGAIGLILNVGPYISEIPQPVMEYCDDNEFPLFTIPWEMRLIDVSFDFCHRIIANEEQETSNAAAFRNLIFSPENKDAYVQALERKGFHNKGSYTLMLIDAVKNENFLLGNEWHNMKFSIQSVLKNVDKPICIFVQENHLVVIGSGVDEEEMAVYAGLLIEKLFAGLEDVQISVGISETVTGYSEMNACYRQAMTASNTAQLQNRRILRYQNTGLYKLIYAVEDTSILKRYTEEILGKIIGYDALHNTDYFNTLKSYLQNNGSIQKVSAQMNVHRNTINYKMKFIRESLDINLDNECIAGLWLAFNIKEILEK